MDFRTANKQTAPKLTNLYTNVTKELVKEAQRRLGFIGKDVDGIAGKKTRVLVKKCLL